MGEHEPVFIQWKGTDVCMDIHCPKCQHHNHYDGYFAYYVRCAGCGAIWELGMSVSLREVPEGETPDLTPLEVAEDEPAAPPARGTVIGPIRVSGTLQEYKGAD